MYRVCHEWDGAVDCWCVCCVQCRSVSADCETVRQLPAHLWGAEGQAFVSRWRCRWKQEERPTGQGHADVGHSVVSSWQGSRRHVFNPLPVRCTHCPLQASWLSLPTFILSTATFVIIKLLLDTQPTFLPWRFGLCQGPLSSKGNKRRRKLQIVCTKFHVLAVRNVT